MEQKLVQIMKPTASEWIVVKDSGIHGKGVYAAKDIPKGTQVIEYVGERISKKEGDELSDEHIDKGKKEGCGMVYVFELNSKYDIDGSVEWNTARLINHSCDPNCETTGDDEHIWISAKRDIKKGEELGYDYGYGIEDFEEHSCKCGAGKCVGYIVREEDRKKLKKKLRWRKIKERRKRGREKKGN